MQANFIPRSCAVFAFVIVASACGFPAVARASEQSPAITIIPSCCSTGSASLQKAVPTGRVFVGQPDDGPEAPAYAARSMVAGSASLIVFSSRPVAPPAGSSYARAGPIGVLGGARLTSSFGVRRHPLLGGRRMHAGIDLAAATGSSILAASDGVVSAAQWNGGYGLYVALEHGGGLQSRYGHMSRLNVSIGERVRKGDVIGFVGSTGRSTGPHLHFETRMNGAAVDPATVRLR